MDTVFSVNSSELDEIYLDLLDSQVEVIADNLEDYRSKSLPDGIPDGTIGKIRHVSHGSNVLKNKIWHDIAIVWNIRGKKFEWTYVREDSFN